MSLQIDHSKPLSDEDKKWLHEWSLDYVIEENERIHGGDTGGEPPDVQAALEAAGFTPPPPPPNPISVAGQGNVGTGPIIVEGENDLPPEPGSIGTRVELPRDHPLTGTVDDSGPVDSVEEWDAKAVRAEIAELNVDDLKENLKELDQPVSGDKAELQKRLYAALKKAHDDQAKAAE